MSYTSPHLLALLKAELARSPDLHAAMMPTPVQKIDPKQIVGDLKRYSQGMIKMMSPNPDSWIICGGATEMVFDLVAKDYANDPRLGYCSLGCAVSLFPANKEGEKNFKALNAITEQALFKAMFTHRIGIDAAFSQIGSVNIFSREKAFMKSVLGEQSLDEARTESKSQGVDPRIFEDLYNLTITALKSKDLDLQTLADMRGTYGHSCALIKVQGCEEPIFADFSARQFDRYLPEDKRPEFPLIVEQLPRELLTKRDSESYLFIPAAQPASSHMLCYRINNLRFNFDNQYIPSGHISIITDRIRSETPMVN